MSSNPWLSLIGLGEDGLAGLSDAARALIAQAALVVGGARHLELIGETKAEQMAWPSPMHEAFPAILARRGEPVVVLASGDPFFFGVGSLIARLVTPEEMLSMPQPSAFSLAASRLGWGLQDCALLSLHGRALERILPYLQPNALILALSWDGETPGKLASLLNARGLGEARIAVLEAMGGPRERVRWAQAGAFNLTGVEPLNTVALALPAKLGERIASKAPGLPDDWFENDGQLTKRDVRALTISALAPRPGETLWDVGAGSGSIAIEWLLAHPTMQAVAFEPRAERAERIRRNATALGVPHLEVLEGAAPETLSDHTSPDAIFIGGGATAEGVFDVCWNALPSGGRLVLNAVTIETQAAVAELYARLGGALLQVQFAHATPVGRFHGFKPAMPVVQWRVVKP